MEIRPDLTAPFQILIDRICGSSCSVQSRRIAAIFHPSASDWKRLVVAAKAKGIYICLLAKHTKLYLAAAATRPSINNKETMAISSRELGIRCKKLERTQTHQENLLCWISSLNINHYQMSRVTTVFVSCTCHLQLVPIRTSKLGSRTPLRV
jgi:hypothetical protein